MRSTIAKRIEPWRCVLTARRRAERTYRQGSLRFALVLLTLIATAVIVTIAMFQTLYYVIG